jgi:ATP-dependent Lon protease
MKSRTPEYQREYQRQKRLRGECRFCVKLALDGMTLCAKHRQKRLEDDRKRTAKKREYYLSNKAKIMKRHLSYQKNKRKTDENTRIAMMTRSKLTAVLKLTPNAGNSKTLTGLDKHELRNYFESLFEEGMSWSNYGKSGWHIDHIIPLRNFDCSDRNQLLEAFNYRNLRPRWGKENMKDNRV